VFKRWLNYYHEYCEEELFNGVEYEEYQSLRGEMDEPSFFKGVPLFDSLWPLRLGPRCLNRLKELPEVQLLDFLTLLRLMSMGLWKDTLLNTKAV
jgi:hypothetical protein